MISYAWNPLEFTRIHPDSLESPESGESDRNRWGTVKHWVVAPCSSSSWAWVRWSLERWFVIDIGVLEAREEVFVALLFLALEKGFISEHLKGNPVAYQASCSCLPAIRFTRKNTTRVITL
jgi:hypothetical protein